VLKVISAATFDLQPVLDTVIETAVRLCGADDGAISIREGEGYRPVSSSFSAAEPEHWAILRQRTIVPGRDTVAGRVALEGRVVHVEDIRAIPDYALPEAVASGRRTMLGVPLLREGAVLGTIVLSRKRVEPFAERQIELVRTFADQAVIAMENARLLTETREALEQQTATAEVLGVINSSPGDLAPVFEALLDRAMRLCQANFGILATFDGECFRRAVVLGVPPPYADYAMHKRVSDAPDGVAGRILGGASIVHVPDLMAEAAYRNGNPDRRALVELGGARTCLSLALRMDDALLGMISFYRQQVRPFNERQIALLQNFAAQAVIAMENARLLTETREALEQQTATAEVLQVINSSPGDLAPVFDAMLEKAVRFCGATMGVLRTFDGDSFPLAAVHGEPEVVARMKELDSVPPRSTGSDLLGRIGNGERIVHVPDARETQIYRNLPASRERIEISGMRTWLGVAPRSTRRRAGRGTGPCRAIEALPGAPIGRDDRLEGR